MRWRKMWFHSCFVTFLLLIVLDGSDTIVKATGEESSEENLKKRVFVQEMDASNFLKKQEKRSARFTDEVNAKNRLLLTADEEEQRNEFENFTEEEHDEQDERSREQIEQWLEDHYDGLSPPSLYDWPMV
ncbi:unique cartilage matrix-associated protein [Candoia aspera]|uniref:unique cartilage matrix-associated protein n=1 Tax=Candoia aspera TaxID=51853 RepID=UPI002FD80D95